MDYMNTREVLEYLKVSKTTLLKLQNEGLPSVMVGSRKRYNREEVSNWVRETTEKKLNPIKS